MKIAVCLSGQPRSLQRGHEYIAKNLLEPYSPDVFVSTWDNVVPTSDWLSINFLYDPKVIVGQKSLSPDYFDKYTRIASPQHPAYNTACMLYQVYKANELKREYELQQGFTYDIVVRLRFDFALNTVLNFENIEPWKLYVPNCRQDPHRVMCNDQLAWGSSEVMDAYSQTFQNADFLYRSGFIYNGEDILSGNLQMYGLTVGNLVYTDVNHPFPSGKYDGLPNSLLREDFTTWNQLRG